MAAEQLLSVLSLYGLSESETVAPALAAACKDEQARSIVQWLAENLRPEHFAEAVQSKTEKQYKLSAKEQAVADSLAASLQAPEASRPALGPTAEMLDDRLKTAGMFASAAEQLRRQAKEAVELKDKERQRVTQRVARLEDQVKEQTREMAGVLSCLEDLVHELASRLSDSKDGEALLCLQRLQDFKELDKELIQTLRSFYHGQFNDPKDAVQEWIPEECMQDALRLLSNDSEQAAAAKALEIERMRLAYGSSLEGNVRMLALQAKQEKTLQALQGGLTRPELSSQDVTMLKMEAEKQQVYLDRVLERKRQLLEVELPQLCKSLASMHCLDAVKADYDIELQRNKYYSAKKGLVLDVLVARTARITALLAAAKSEAGSLVGMRDSLQLLTEELDLLTSSMQLRIAKCKAVSSLPPPPPPPPFSGSKAPAASTMEVMQAAFDGQLGEALEQAIPRLQQTSGCIHTLLFDSASSTDPVLTAKELTEAKRSLEAVHRSLLEANDAVYKQQEAYNNIMRLQRDQIGLERSVFPLFFTKPEQLAKEVQKLEKGPDSSKTVVPKSSRRVKQR